jgi:hypothetical protein
MKNEEYLLDESTAPINNCAQTGVAMAERQ